MEGSQQQSFGLDNLDSGADDQVQQQRTANNKSSQQQQRRIIPRSKISPPSKPISQSVVIFNSHAFAGRDTNPNGSQLRTGLESAGLEAGVKQRSGHKTFEIVEDVPTTLKRPLGGGADRSTNYERFVIELNQMKFKLSGS